MEEVTLLPRSTRERESDEVTSDGSRHPGISRHNQADPGRFRPGDKGQPSYITLLSLLLLLLRV